MRKGTYSYMHDNFVRAWSHCAVCAFVVSSQAENSVGFCKPMRAVTDRIMLLTNVWNGLLRRQKLFGRVSWCLYPLFLPSLPSPPNGWVSHSLGQESESKRCEAKGCSFCPICGCAENEYSELLFRVFQSSPSFEECLSNWLLDFLTWHTMCSAAF